ncbi:uncharacterized protein LOC9651144 [Selaginella moellendorffii]|uniref:uncharacterized protein LOC9651144 n=1 Tax=Selaginella moellendorffii TaxID=88036 RepID=UPI000D1C9A31|nr:uncharacterized protein LOC9651144 [Selaginella moellendorffii]|eukprot:XP_024544292.1 uncharacterized protein LOC9651144 [Selaginella moellendorffii]
MGMINRETPDFLQMVLMEVVRVPAVNMLAQGFGRGRMNMASYDGLYVLPFYHLTSYGEFGFPHPGEQYPTSTSIMNDLFFVPSWDSVQQSGPFDYIIVGTGFCGYAFAAQILEKSPHAKILMLERGPFFLPAHFQSLPLALQGTVAAKLESYPWTLTQATAESPYAKWVHGVAPFFGGRSTKWSGWCPRPTAQEMEGWHPSVIDAAGRYFERAERLLNVTNSFYRSALQEEIMQLMHSRLHTVSSAMRVMPAPLSIEDGSKFSVVGSLLQLVLRQRTLAKQGHGAPLRIVINCVVKRISESEGVLETSKGEVTLSARTRIVLAMGAIPPATLLVNSIPALAKAPLQFSSHLISAITARVPRKEYPFASRLDIQQTPQIGAFYLAGVHGKLQFHIQATVISSPSLEPEDIITMGHRMPDVLTSATPEQLKQSKEYVLFVFAILGEQEIKNSSWIRKNDKDPDLTTNIKLQIQQSRGDMEVWDAMEAGAFQVLENILSPNKSSSLQYWNKDKWTSQRPAKKVTRRPGCVHEGSSLPIGDDGNQLVDLDYRLAGSQNIYITGAALWPRSGSWNPTLTMVALTLDLADRLSS